MDDTTATAQRNKALVQRIFDLGRQGDRTAFVDHLAQDATMTITGDYSWSQTFRGKQRILEDLYGFVRSRVAQRNPTDGFHFLADGDWVVVEARGDMVTLDGQPYRNHYCLLFRLQGGMIVEMKEYQDSAMCERLLGPYPAALRRKNVTPRATAAT